MSGHARARRRLTRQAADSASQAEAATRHAEEARSAAAQVATEAERAIREAEALFRGAFESAAFGMTITDMDLRFLRVNEAMCRLTGRTEAELLTLGVADITHPDDQALRDRQVGRLVDGGTEHYAIEKRYIRPDGTTRWARVNVSMIRDANGAPVVLVGQIEDIEAARKAEEDLRAVQRRFQALVEHSSDIITVFDDTGTILFASPSADRILGYPEGTQLGRSVFELLHPEDVGQAQISLRGSAIEAGAAIAVQLRVRHADGTWRDVETVATNLLDDPDVAGIVMNSRDVTEREQAAAEITFRAFHDLLTGLPNRALLLDRLSHALHRAKRSGDLVAVLYLDLDRFKLVNDSLGHAAGDELLAEVARRLTRAVRPGDTVGRIGGDEFVVVAESVEGVGGARTVAERISGALAAPVLLSSGDEIVVTTSVGIAVSTHHRPDELLQEADTALYRAKEAGRDQYVVYDETFRERARHRMHTERILRNALEGGGMALHYQPIVDLDTGRVRGVEALLRVRDESGELVGPADLIPVAEDTGLIVAMGAGITAEACRQAVAWDRILRDAAPAYVSVNVSARQLTTPGFTAHVAAALKGADASPGSLCLELTEGVLIEGGRTTLRTLDELHTMGVLLAIDDFGTGYSSMAYLKRFPIDIVKIDRAFISGLGTDPEDPAIVRAIITLGDALGLTIIAEGIEDATQLSILQQLGCAQGQGFLFARPLPPEALEAHLTAHVFV